jgi:hypothetical protein
MLKSIQIFVFLFTFIGKLYCQSGDSSNLIELNKNDSIILNNLSNENEYFNSQFDLFTEQISISTFNLCGINNPKSINEGFGLSIKISHQMNKENLKRYSLYWGFGFDYLNFKKVKYYFSTYDFSESETTAFCFNSHIDYEFLKTKHLNCFIEPFTGIRSYNPNQTLVRTNSGTKKLGVPGNDVYNITLYLGLGFGFKIKISEICLVKLTYSMDYGGAGNMNDYTSMILGTKGNEFFQKDSKSIFNMLGIGFVFKSKPTSKR